MINGIWKNIIYPEKFCTLSVHMPANGDLQSEVMSPIKPTDTNADRTIEKCFGPFNVFFKS